MIEYYCLIDDFKKIEDTFSATFNYSYIPSLCVGKGDKAPVMIQGMSFELCEMKFGFPPAAAKEPMEIVNARAEGKGNKENKTDRIYPKGITKNGYFAAAIRKRRCAIPASALYLCGGNQYQYDWFLAHFSDKKYRPFALAGMWDTWTNPDTKETTTGFCIITVAASKLGTDLGQQRMPLLLHHDHVKKWLSNATDLSIITKMLEPNLNAEIPGVMNAYPVNKQVTRVMNPDREWIMPHGKHLYPVKKVYVPRK